MKTKKLNFEAFESNELTRNQKMAILGKGDAIVMSTTLSTDPIILSTTTTITTPTVPPILGGGNGDGKIIG